MKIKSTFSIFNFITFIYIINTNPCTPPKFLDVITYNCVEKCPNSPEQYYGDDNSG